MRRREFVAAALAVPVAPALARDVARLVPAPRDAIRIASPNGSVEFELRHAVGPRLSYGVTFRNQRVIEPSPLGIVVDGVDLGQGVEAGTVESYYGNERYPWRGVHAEAINRFKGARIAVRHTASATDYLVEVRVFDDGIGFRCVVPGEGSRVPDEATAFVLPARATVWYHDLRGHYEGTHTKKDITEAAAGDWAAPPLTVKLPDAAGYAAITEAAVINYSGMVLQADGQGGFRARLGHAPPASYPFTLRYGEAEAARLAQPAAIAGTITTPWRVVMIGPDLNALVNCDIVPNLSPPPEPRLFPKGLHTDWIKPGRAVWKYLDGGGENTLETMKEFSRLAGELGFEYNLVEGFWQRWSGRAWWRGHSTTRRSRSPGCWPGTWTLRRCCSASAAARPPGRTRSPRRRCSRLRCWSMVRTPRPSSSTRRPS